MAATSSSSSRSRTRLQYPDYLRHIRAESARFREVLAGCDPSAPVHSCPGWTAADLLFHLAGVQRFWATMVRRRPAAPTEADREVARPETYDALLALFDDASADLVSALEEADPAAEAWTWSADHTVGFIYRRQAHEALIHRLDAEIAAETPSPLDPVLASDGVDEALDVMFGGLPSWGRWDPLPHYVRVDCSDTGARVWVQLGLFSGTDPDGTQHSGVDDVHVVDEPGVEPDAVVTGLAGDLDAWLWRRRDGADLHVAGDRRIYDRFRRCVNEPIT